MVSLSYGYCIDSTEVSQSQYGAFLAAIRGGYVPPMPPRCEWNPTYGLPTDGWCVTQPNDPVACSNWCDAYAFCQWAGKHLCGAPDGGTVGAVDAAVDPSVSAWAKACTANGTRQYSYGSTYEPVCNAVSPDGGGVDMDATSPVGSDTMCEGPPGVFDLIGNASEWIDACDELDAGFNDNCAHLGGAAGDRYPRNCISLDWDERSFQEAVGYAQGFRCCSP
jgi:formylglycine-generating enzyme required for sulfatase activity